MRNQITSLGIDLAKNVFELCGLDAGHAVVYRRRVRRGQLLATLAQLKVEVVGLEACAGAHDWARRFRALGHDVRLLAPQHVKPFVQGQKNDRQDAQAIAVAATQGHLPTVAIKSRDQQDIQSLHRVRELHKQQRTQLINQARGLLHEYGLVLPAGVAGFRRGAAAALDDARLSPLLRQLLADLLARYRATDDQVRAYDRQIEALGRQLPVCRRLQAIEGIGPLTATALYAHVGDARYFARGRQFSASLGLVPRQYSSGDKRRLGGISKRGDRYLRTLLIHGARAVLTRAQHLSGRRGAWLRQRLAQQGANRAAVALANKNARIAWALMAHDCDYQPA